MGRLKIVLNLVILAIGAFIAWHEYHHPPAAKPKPAPAPPPKPSPTPTASAPAEPTAPPPAAPAAPATRSDRAETSVTKTPAPSLAPSDGAGDPASPEERAATRVHELTEEPAVPENAVRGDGSRDCPADHPIKGNATSRIYHEPGRPSYDRTIPEFCFNSVEAAEAAGFRAPRH